LLLPVAASAARSHASLEPKQTAPVILRFQFGFRVAMLPHNLKADSHANAD
jgi:hypothetical protein